VAAIGGQARMIVLRTFGTASIEIEGSTTITPSSPRRFALLLYLAAEHGRDVSREQLTNLVFADQSPAEASHSLREALYQLRRAGLSLPNTATGFTIPSDQVRADYEAALRDSAIDDEMLRAMAGGFLPAFAPPKSESYAEWLDALRATQAVAITRRLLPDLEQAMHGAEWDAAERIARACLALDPCNERANFALAEILSTGGSKAAALQLIDRYTREIGPQSPDLMRRAAILQRRISNGKGFASVGFAENDMAAGYSSPRLVGRTPDFAALLEAFDRAQSGEPQCVVVAGEPGIGKTRLAGDFSETAAMRGARVERVTSQPHDGSRPMGAFVDLVPALLEAGGALGCSPTALAALQNLTGQRTVGSDEEPATGAEEHEQRWTSVSRAVVELCEAIAAEKTVVLVIEDAHWLDALSANTIGRIVGTRRAARIMVVATTRDHRPLLREIRLTERCRTLSLAPLSAEASNELLDLVLPSPGSVVREGHAEDGPSLKARIAANSAGNPLFLITLAAHSRAHRGPFEVPGTIVEMFAQRIDRLSRQSTIVLATCAEFGKHSTVERLKRALEIRSHQFAEALLELHDSGLILRDGQNAIPAHPLVSESLRTRLPEAGRRAVSHAVAASLEEDAEAGASPALWWDVARSWRIAGMAEKAIYALKQCARHALAIGRPGEAARVLNEAAELPQSVESLTEVSELLISASDAAAEYALVRRGFHLRRRGRVSRQHDDLEVVESRALLCLEHSEESIVDRSLECLSAIEATPSHRINAAVTLLKCADMFGRDDLSARVVNATSQDDLAAVDALLQLEFQLLAASLDARHGEAAAIARRILAECSATSESTALHLHRNAATALIRAGDSVGAYEALTSLFSSGERRGSPRAQLYASVQLSALLADLDNDNEGQVWLDRAIALTTESDSLAGDFELLALRVETQLLHEEFQGAENVLKTAEIAGTLSSGICQRFLRAANLGIQVGLGRQDDALPILAQAIVNDKLRTMTGVREFEMAIAIGALARLDCRADARRALKGYLVERDEPRPPSRLLRDSARRAGCSRLLDALGLASTGRSSAQELNRDRPGQRRLHEPDASLRLPPT
jgi:DNA-binding SARP family transcriptional activator